MLEYVCNICIFARPAGLYFFLETKEIRMTNTGV